MSSDEEIRKHQDYIAESIVRPFRMAVMDEKNRFIIEQAERHDVLAPVNDLDFGAHKGNMEAIFNKYYRVTIRTFSNEIITSTTKSSFYNIEKKASFWEFLFGSWVTARGAQAATETAGTTKSDIQKAITTAQQSEEAIPRTKLVSDILKVRGLSAYRSDVIARTEVGMAASYASVESARKVSADSGVQFKKKWVPALDERTRVSHAVMASSPAIGMGEKFIVNGERLDRPRDPAGSAGNIIQCRCALVYEEF